MKKMVRHRFFYMLLAAILGLNLIYVHAEEETVEPKTAVCGEMALKESNALLENLFDSTLFVKDDEIVTRSEFVSGALKLMQIPLISAEEGSYSDVTEESEYFDAINTACAMGIIAEGEKFYPNDPITLPQALKILIHCVKREREASSGGYPDGYVKVAYQMKLLKNVSYIEDARISNGVAKVLFYNLLNAEAYKISSYSTQNTAYVLGPENYLETVWGITSFDGIVTSTGYSSLLMNDAIRSDKIFIDGIEYKSKLLDPSMLGKKAKVYYYKNEERICCVTEKAGANNELNFLAEDYVGIDSSYMKFSKGSSSNTKVRLDSAYKVIYNGRRVSKLQGYMFNDIGAEIRLLDNNNDSSYDIVFIDGYKYGYVSGVSIVDQKVGIKLPGKSIDLYNSGDKMIRIYNENDEEIELFELENNKIVAFKMSDDEVVCEIRVCGSRVSGKISKIDQGDNILGLMSTEYIETRELNSRYEEVEREYKYSNDFGTENMTMLRIGDNLNAVLGVHGEIVYLNSNDLGSKYGYYIEVKSKHGGNELYAKILSTSCQFEMLNFANKVTIDGTSGYNPDTAYTYLTTVAPQVVKYTLNSEGEIRVLDFASTDTSNFAKHVSDSKNNLVRYYSHTDAKLTYRSGCRGFNNVALLGTATILIVPNGVANLDDTTNFKTGNYSQLVSGNSYSVDIYNVDEYGMAEFAVIYYDITSPIGMKSTKSCIVDKVFDSYNEEEEEVGKSITCWCEDKFYTYFIPNSVTATKTSGADICSGDIIRIEVTESGVIKRIAVDYDFSTGKPVYDSSGGASHVETGESSLSFTEGKLFSQSTTSFMLCSKLNLAGTAYDYSYVNLRPYYATSIIALYDTETKTVRSITKSELHDYQGYGNANDYIVVRQDYGSSKVVYAFR